MLPAMSTILTDLLACPRCGGRLEDRSESLLCNSCGHTYPRENGVPNLVLTARADTGLEPPGVVARALESIVAIPFVYDTLQRLAGAERIFRRIRPILEQADGALVLDAGAGTGNLETLLPKAARYLWLDQDPQKLGGFRAKSTAAAVLADATSLPIRDGSVDWSLSVGVSHHLDDEQFGRMLDELRRVTRERLLFLDAVVTPSITSRLLWRYDRGRHPRTAEVLRRAVAARFRIVSDEEFTVRHRYLLLTAH
jgi:SAM-dependent methyltransferase